MSPFSRDAGTSTFGWRACRPLRMRVSMSAIGSVVVILSHSFASEAHHHEALITPGTSPASANWRKQMRHSLNFRKNPRGRPQRKHRLRCRQLSFGLCAAFAIASFSSLAILAVVAMCLLLLSAERHSKMFQQRQTLRIGLGAGGDADIHPLGFVDLVIVDLRENKLVVNTQRVIAAAVE